MVWRDFNQGCILEVGKTVQWNQTPICMGVDGCFKGRMKEWEGGVVSTVREMNNYKKLQGDSVPEQASWVC